MFANLLDEYHFMIHYNPRLKPGHKRQCYRFLADYGNGIELCERYLGIALGEVIVQKTIVSPFYTQVRNLLLEQPGLTKKELAHALDCKLLSMANCLNSGFNKGRFTKKGSKYYAAN